MQPYSPTQRVVSWLSLVLSAASLVGQAFWFDRTSSVTFDETFYANCAIKTVRTGRIDDRFAEYGVAPLPVLLCYGPPALFLGGESERNPFRGNASHCPIVSAARVINSLFSGVGLVLLVFCWLWKRVGPVGAAVGGTLLAFCPALVAHAALATADAPFAFCALLSLAALVWYRACRSPLRFLALAASIGLTLSMKYSGVFLLPVAAIVLGYDEFRIAGERRGVGPPWRVASGWGYDLSRTLGALVLLMYCAFFVAWALHGFAFSRPLENLVWRINQSPTLWLRNLASVSVPTPVAGFLAQYLHNEVGHPAFLLGERSTTGWRSYYPWTLLLKSTPVEMLLALALLATILRQGVAVLRHGVVHARLDSTRQVWLVAASAFLALLIVSDIDIGHRYALLLYPLLVLASVDSLWPKGESSPSIRMTLAACLMLAQFLGSLWTGPDKLSYFTPLVGGPKQGYHYLVDSNVDWGQDLPRLKTGKRSLNSILASAGNVMAGTFHQPGEFSRCEVQVQNARPIGGG